MEVEDPILSKFRTLIGSVMVKTTSEIVNIFAKVLKEMRVEISRSWTEIDVLRQQLEECQRRCTEAVFRTQVSYDLKNEREETEVAQMSTQVLAGQPRSEAEVAGRNRNLKPSNTESHGVGSPQTGRAGSKPQFNTVTVTAVSSPDRNQSVKRATATHTPAESTGFLLQPGIGAKISPQPKTAPAVDTQTSSLARSDVIEMGQSSGGDTGMMKSKFVKKNPKAKLARTAPLPTPRNRRHISGHKRCVCCSSKECPSPKIQPTDLDERLFKCSECENTFKGWLDFKKHRCPCHITCNVCGEEFTTVRALAIHKGKRPANRKCLYSCHHCRQKFPTKCSYNLHKSIHSNSTHVQTTQRDPPMSFPFNRLPKELKAKVEVRVERISDADLKAALASKGTLWVATKNPNLTPLAETAAVRSSPTPEGASNESARKTASQDAVDAKDSPAAAPSDVPLTSEVKDSSQGGAIAVGENEAPVADATSRQIIEGKDAALPSSGQREDNQEKRSQENQNEKEPLGCGGATGGAMKNNEGGTEGGDEEEPSNSNPKNSPSTKKRRMITDCTHDFYSGLFPVEKILCSRMNKGRKEVRVKWMPCSACGIKWKNTWEPAESFASLLDDKMT